MNQQKRRKTPTVQIGNILIGCRHPVVIQSMTDTPTADIDATLTQTIELVKAGSQLVRWTINDDKAAQAVPEIIKRLQQKGYATPIIGDFHFNGHQLLTKHPEMAKALEKYRINPGNIGKGKQQDDNFATFIKIAKKYKKPIRIGVNRGSLNRELLARMMDKNAKLKNPKPLKEIIYQAMVKSALDSTNYAIKSGLRKNQIILSVKMSNLQDMVEVYTRLAEKCDFALHLGLTEAGSDVDGITSSSAALAILLQQGIGDTIRVSLTPQPGISRRREVEVCKALLQSMGLRYFAPKVTSCPGCGRTNSDYYQKLASDINKHIAKKMPAWQKKHPGVERLNIAIMGCVVNGPGESRHADIGISLPGAFEKPVAPVYFDGKQQKILKGKNIKNEFINILEKYIQQRYQSHATNSQ